MQQCAHPWDFIPLTLAFPQYCPITIPPLFLLQFIEEENSSLAVQLEDLDNSLSEKRDRLGKAKAMRDGLRQRGRKIKETSVFITSPSLLDDIEVGGQAGEKVNQWFASKGDR